MKTKATTKLITIGSSKGIILPKRILDDAGITKNTEFKITLKNGELILTPERDVMESFAKFMESDKFDPSKTNEYDGFDFQTQDQKNGTTSLLDRSRPE